MTQVPDQSFADALLAQTSWLRALVRSLVEDTARIDDVCQATMLQAWKSRPAQDRSLRPWLARVAQNLNRQLRWRERQRPERESRAASPDLAPSAAQVVERVAWQQTMVGLVMALDEPYRSTILLRFWEDSPPRTVARRMKVPVETVRTRIKRGLAILRTRLDRRCGDRQIWVTALLPLAQLEGALLPLTAVLIMTKKIASIAAILLAGLAVGYLFLDDGSAPSPTVPGLSPADGELSLAFENDMPATANGLQRSELAASASRSDPVAVEDDPVIAAALCGFRGRIVDTAGTALADCEVRIHRFSFDRLVTAGVGLLGENGRGPGLVRHSATTGADGRFLVSGVWPRGMYFLVSDSPAKGRTMRLVERAPAPGEVVDLGDLVLVADAVITGMVVNERGDPVSGARVRAVDLPGALFETAYLDRFDPQGNLILRDWAMMVGPVISVPPWLRDLYAELPIATALSDASGRFQLTGVMPGENTVLVDREPWMPAIRLGVRTQSGVTEDIGNIRMSAGEELRGQVVDVNGEAVAGAEVLVAPTSETIPVDFAKLVAPTDMRGGFRSSGMPPGRVSIAVRRSPDHEWHVAQPQPVTGEAVVHLPAACELELVVHSGIGRPIEDLQLELLRGELGRQAIAFRTIGLQDPVNLADRVTRQSDTTWKVTDLDPGSYIVAVTSAGHAPALRSVFLPVAEPIEFELDEEQVHDIRVVDRTGASLRNVEVFAEPNNARDMEDAPLPINCGRTGADGRLRISGISHPELRVTVSHPTYGMVAVVVPRALREVEVILDRPGAIDGQLLEDGAAPELGRYTILVTLRETISQGVIERTPNFVAPGRYGHFALEGMQPGRYTLTAIPGTSTASSIGGLAGVVFASDQEDAPATTVEVKADRRTEARILIGAAPDSVEPSARLSGTVWLNSAPHAGMQIRLRSDEGVDVAVTHTDALGLFDTGLVPADNYRVSVYSPSDSEHAVHVRGYDLAAGDSVNMVVEVATATLGGQVFNIAGEPVAGAIVDIIRTPTDGGSLMHFRAYCDRRGMFETKLLPIGPYSLRVSSQRPAAIAPERLLELAAGEQLTDLRFELQAGFELGGHLDRRAYGLTDAGTISLRLRRSQQTATGSAGWLMVAKTTLQAGDRFAFTGLTSGSYMITLETETEDGERYVHSGPIKIVDGSITNLEIIPEER